MKKTLLLTNDDGYQAVGIHALYHVLKDHFDVTMVAPEHEHSGQSHAITLGRPIYARSLDLNGEINGFSVSGTPADCVKLAIGNLLPAVPDIVVSGMNLGENSGQSAFYSGTVGAAREGAFWKIPSFAISLDKEGLEHVEGFAPYALNLVQEVLRRRPEVPKDEHNVVMYNINFPACGPKEMKGLRVTRKSYAVFDDRYDQIQHESGKIGYQLAGSKCPAEDELNFDSRALAEGYATLTPLDLDTTSIEALADLAEMENA